MELLPGNLCSPVWSDCVPLAKLLSLLLLLLQGVLQSIDRVGVDAVRVTPFPAYGVDIIPNVTYGYGLKCTDASYKNCTPMQLQLDIFRPADNATATGYIATGTTTITTVSSSKDNSSSNVGVAQQSTSGAGYLPNNRTQLSQPLSPAIILSHGGANSAGDKNQNCFIQTARFFASRGYVAYNINYRLRLDYGKSPTVIPTPPPGLHPGVRLVTAARGPAYPGSKCLAFSPAPRRNSGSTSTTITLHRSNDDGSLDKGGQGGGGGGGGNWPSNQPYMGPISVHFNGTAHTKPLSLCMTPGNATTKIAETSVDSPIPVKLQPCTNTSDAQVFGRNHRDSIAEEAIVHRASGLCLDIQQQQSQQQQQQQKTTQPKEPTTANTWSTGTIGVVLRKCNVSSPTQKWVFGYSGVIVTKIQQASEASKGKSRSRVSRRNSNIQDLCATFEGLQQTAAEPDLLEWKPNWQSGYPAVRDLKAAVRFVRATAPTYGVDVSRVAVSGGSAGATNSLAAGVVLEEDYKSELSATEDPTLSTTHLEQSSAVQCVYAHWSSHGEVDLVQNYDPQHKSRWSRSNAPIIEFHGAVDHTIPITQAYETQAEYNKTGVPYELHVMPKCAHAAWCYGCGDQCSCSDGVNGYCSHMDEVAFPFVTRALNVSGVF